MLRELVDNDLTDKDTVHSYLDAYEELFSSKKNDNLSLLEIGNWKGGSLNLWAKYFENAIIHGMDLDHSNISVILDERITLTECDAYDKKNVPTTKYDIMIDDGPHTFASIMKFLFYYIPLLKDDGIAIIEDIQYLGWIGTLTIIVEEHYPELKDCIVVKDLTKNKNRYDDILFIIDKRLLKNVSA